MALTQNNLVAVFDSYATAQKAQDDLISKGFNRSDVQIASGSNSSQTATGGDAYAGSSTSTSEHEGGVSGFFKRLFGSDETHEDRGRYETAVHGGQAVLTVSGSNDRLESAADILDRYDPIDIDQNSASTTTAKAPAKMAAGRTMSEGGTIPVVEEDLQVGKRSFQSGGVRVYSRVIEEPVEEDVTLTEERVRVDRRPVNRAATEADFTSGNDMIEMVETSEEAVVGKRARVVEEVVVGKDSSQRTETIRDTVRRTDVEVERIPSEALSDFRSDYQSRYGSQAGADFETYEPDYEYGYGMAGEPSYKGKDWDSIQDTVKTDYMRNNPNSAWDRASGAIRYGWERATNKR